VTTSGDSLALDGYIGASNRFTDAVTTFAIDYADQTERDYETFLHSRFAPHAKSSQATPVKTKRSKPKAAPVVKEVTPEAKVSPGKA